MAANATIDEIIKSTFHYFPRNDSYAIPGKLTTFIPNKLKFSYHPLQASTILMLLMLHFQSSVALSSFKCKRDSLLWKLASSDERTVSIS